MTPRKKLSLNQKNKGAAIEKPLFVVQGCLEMSVNSTVNSKVSSEAVRSILNIDIQFHSPIMIIDDYIMCVSTVLL